MSGKQAKAQRAAARAAAVAAARSETLSGRQYWHGGTAGLGVGTGLWTKNDALRAQQLTAHFGQQSYNDGTTEPDRVYFTTDRELARAFACTVSRGALYRVMPLGPTEPDADFAGVGWKAPGARIVAVEEEPVTLTSIERVQRFAPYMRWPSGEPIYDETGRFLVSSQQRALGLTQQWADALFEPWTDYQLHIKRRLLAEVAALNS